MKFTKENLLNILQNIPFIEIVFILFFSSYLLLFNPFDIIVMFGMEEFVLKYSLYFGITFIITFSYLVLQISKKSYVWIKYNPIYNAKIKRNVANLTSDETQFIKHYFFDDSTKKLSITSNLPYSNGITTLLVGKKIIYWSGGRTAISHGHDMRVPFNLTRIAFETLRRELENNT